MPPIERFLAPAAPAPSEATRTAALRAWIEGSAFAADGSPRLWYHGTDCEEAFNVFARYDESSVGFHFGAAEAANARLDAIFRMEDPAARGGALIPVICRARSPLRLPDLYTWEQDAVAGALLAAGIVDEREAEDIVDSCDEHMLFAAIERGGHDCVVYTNLCEHEAGAVDSLMLWRAELVKSPFAAGFDPDDPRILPQAATGAPDLRAWSERSEAIAEARLALARVPPRLG